MNYRLPPGAPTRSPWGQVQSALALGPLWQVGTAGHGGIKVPRELNAKIPKPYRLAGGWYEEDCNWSIPALMWPEHFPKHAADGAHDTAKNWCPDFYAWFTGKPVAVEESYILRERAFRAATASSYVVTAAWGDWHERVPKGMVGCVASLAGSRAPGTSHRWFLVPADEYEKRQDFGFIIDLSKHREVESFNAPTKEVVPS